MSRFLIFVFGLFLSLSAPSLTFANTSNPKEAIIVCTLENTVTNFKFTDINNVEVNGQNYKYNGDLAIVVGNKQTGQSVLWMILSDNTNSSFGVSGAINSSDPGIVTIPPTKNFGFNYTVKKQKLGMRFANFPNDTLSKYLPILCYK
jgi:hypothetical protein